MRVFGFLLFSSFCLCSVLAQEVKDRAEEGVDNDWMTPEFEDLQKQFMAAFEDNNQERMNELLSKLLGMSGEEDIKDIQGEDKLSGSESDEDTENNLGKDI